MAWIQLAEREDKKKIILSLLATLENDICNTVCKYELIDNNQIIATEIEEIKVRIYDDLEILIDILTEIGFKEIKLVKAFDRAGVPSKDDEVIIYECRK